MRLTKTLADSLKKYMPEETILISASLGEGRRLLQTCAEEGYILVGVRVVTPRSLAQEICAKFLSEENAPQLLETAAAQDLMFRTLKEMPEEGFFAGEHAKDRKTAELMYGIISELEMNVVNAVGGNPRQEAVQAIREQYVAAKGGCLLDEYDLMRMAINRAAEFFAGEKVHFMTLGTSIFGKLEMDLIWAAAGGHLDIVPVTVSDAVPVPEECVRKEAAAVKIDTAHLHFVRCRGVETEERFIMRDILTNHYPVEDCAVIYMSSDYATGLYAEAQHYHIPMTISGGVSLTGSLVFMALSELNSWAASEFDAEKLRALMLSGAIFLQASGSFVRRLRDKNIGWGRKRYTERFLVVTEDEKYPPDADALNAWKDFVEVMISIAEKSGDISAQKESIRAFLGSYASVRSKAEGSAVARAQELLSNITWLDEGETVLGRLIELMESASCMTGHEEPGKLYATTLSGGLCTGRKVLYICGLSRFSMQGGRQESPLLLDEEKRAYGLQTMAERERENAFRLHLILLQHVGDAFISYCDYDTERMIELQPAPVYRELRGNREVKAVTYISQECYSVGDLQSGGRKVSIKRDYSADPADDQTLAELTEAVNYQDCLNSYAYSSTSLEEALDCPAKFYMKRIIGLRPTQIPERSNDAWLDAMEMGTLCHEILKRFYAGEGTLDQIFDEEIAKVKEGRPVAGDMAVQNDTQQVRNMVNHAVRWTSEEGHVVVATEKPFGKNAGEDPIELEIGDRMIRLSGSIDRVDTLPDGATAILDYKTGASKHYRENEAIKLQPYLYTLAAEQLDPSLKISASGYLFLKETADYLPVPQTAATRELKAKVICGLLDWMQDEEKAQTAAPAFEITAEDGLVGTGDFKAREARYDGGGHGCRSWCEYAGLCSAARQIAAAKTAESEVELLEGRG